MCDGRMATRLGEWLAGPALGEARQFSLRLRAALTGSGPAPLDFAQASRHPAWVLALLLGCGSVQAQSGIGDPTRPTSLSEPDTATAAVQGPRWRLQSTLVADERRLAVINGRTIAQGGRIDGATLVEVRQDGVTLEAEGQRIQLRLVPVTINVKQSGG